MTFRRLSSNKPRTAKLKTLGNSRPGKSLLAFMCLLLASCAGNSTSSTSSSEADKMAAVAKLERMKQSKQRAMDAEAEQQRIADEKAAAIAAEQQAAAERAAIEAAKPHYDPQRLAIAVKWRQWADITVPDLNIHAWLKSNWKDGNMHMRLALLGDKTALRLFTGQWPYIRLVFADQGGTNLHQCILATRDLHWADGLRNSGTPTMEFEADSECSLEVYESIVQWNLKWEDHID